MIPADPRLLLLALLSAAAVGLLTLPGCAPLVDPWTERPEVRCRAGGKPVLLAPDLYRCPGAAGGAARP